MNQKIKIKEWKENVLFTSRNSNFQTLKIPNFYFRMISNLVIQWQINELKI